MRPHNLEVLLIIDMLFSSGFGTQMANTPMFIMWPNSDGSLTLSQRRAPGEVMPTVDSSPPRVASADAAASDLSGTQPKLTFTIPVRQLHYTSPDPDGARRCRCQRRL